MASRGPISGAHDNIEQVDTNLCYNGPLRPAGPVDPQITYLCHCDHARLMAVTRFAAMVPTLVAWTAALGDFVLQQLNGQSQPQSIELFSGSFGGWTKSLISIAQELAT